MKQKGDRRTDDVAVGFVRNHSASLGRSVRSIYCVEKKHVLRLPSGSRRKPTVHAYVTVPCSTALVVPVEGA